MGKLSVLQRATIETFLECKASSDGRVTRLDGQQLPWRDLLDALLAADLFCTLVAGQEGFPLASQVTEKILGGDAGESAIVERAETIRHWLTPVRVLGVLHEVHRILDVEALVRNARSRRT
jgi:hypothetical protein